MRKYLLLLLLMLNFLSAKAQKLAVTSFDAKPNDVTASTYERKDLNGNSCALVKVQLAMDGAQFSPKVVGDVKYEVNEYWVYLPTMYKHLEVRHPEFLPLDVVFADYGVKLEPKTTYSLVLSIPNVTSSKYGSVSVAVTPDGSDVYIDNKKVGTTPLFLQNILVGKHKIEVKKSGYQAWVDNIIVQGNTTYNIENKELAIGSANELSSTIAHSFTVNGVSFDMIMVEAGTFNMGATKEMENPAEYEKPVHQVILTNNYYMGKFEVTQALWQAVMGSNPSKFKGNNLPVERVSWNDCQEFISKLNRITGKNFRLPTEAEWEYAARGGNKNRECQYSGSNNLSDVAWYDDNSSGKTHPVGTKKSNELGIYDMSGNVSEWVQDWYDNYSSSALTNPQGSKISTSRLLRGGSWLTNAWCCRSSGRSMNSPDDHHTDLGLRLCLSE